MKKQLEHILSNEIDPAFSRRARVIFEIVEKEKPARVLDAGCGRGFYVNSFTNFSFVKEIHGFDINENYLTITKQHITDKRIRIQKADIYKLPYPDNYFDFIVCSEVLEHLSGDVAGLNELKRILNKKGTLAITVPNKNFPFLWDPINWMLMRLFNTHIDKNIWWLAGIWADHERLYKPHKVVSVLKTQGFKVLQIREFVHWCWPFSHFLLYGIGKNIVERFKVQSFNRFNSKKQSLLNWMVARFFELPTKLLDRNKVRNGCVIVLTCKK